MQEQKSNRFLDHLDNALLLLFQQGDRLAYEEISNRYWPILFRHGRKMLQNDEEAKDLVQDVFSIFWTEGDKLKIQNSVSAYLYSVMRPFDKTLILSTLKSL